jgi:cold shock protein
VATAEVAASALRQAAVIEDIDLRTQRGYPALGSADSVASASNRCVRFVTTVASGDVFVHISAVERAGKSTLNEGQTIEYEVVANRGKESAENLKVK